jgi:hypothetical protein
LRKAAIDQTLGKALQGVGKNIILPHIISTILE